MKLLNIIAVIALLSLITHLQAEDPSGLKDYGFGAEKDLIKTQIISGHNMRRKFPVPGAPMSGSDGVDLEDKGGKLILKNYPYSGRIYTITMYFNSNEKFYGYMFEGKGYMNGEINPVLREEVLSLSKYFQQRYGPAGSKLHIQFRGATQRAETKFPIRDDNEFIVMTGLVQRRAVLGSGTTLHAVAVVCDKDLRKEPEILEETKRQDKNESARRRRWRKDL